MYTVWCSKGPNCPWARNWNTVLKLFSWGWLYLDPMNPSKEKKVILWTSDSMLSKISSNSCTSFISEDTEPPAAHMGNCYCSIQYSVQMVIQYSTTMKHRFKWEPFVSSGLTHKERKLPPHVEMSFVSLLLSSMADPSPVSFYHSTHYASSWHVQTISAHSSSPYFVSKSVYFSDLLVSNPILTSSSLPPPALLPVSWSVL